MQVDCPQCGELIEDADINVATDVAFCRACDSGHKLSKLIHGDEDGSFDDEVIDIDIHNPPAGAWFEQQGSDIRVGATCRVRALAIFLVPFTAVWAGGSMAGIYGSQIAEGEFDIIRSLFGIPFAIGSVFLVTLTLFALFGRVEVTIRDREGEVFTGFGSIGKRRTFNTDDIRIVRQETIQSQTSNHRRTVPQRVIVLVGKEPIKFATMMTNERRHFVMGVLRTLLDKS